VFGSLSVHDNLQLAAKGPRGVFANLRAHKKAADGRLEECLETIGLHAKSQTLAEALSHGEKQWLEIGMLLMQQPALLLLDEPAAGMTDEETHQMGELLGHIARDENNDVRSILVVEHDMEFVRRFAHKVTVMHEGRILREGTMDEVQSDPRVAEVYLGRRVEAEA
jgi:urea transport system ATP-binding protein